MKKSTKRRMGRPPTGRDPSITVRLPAPVIVAVERLAKQSGVTRSEAFRRLVELGLGVGSHSDPGIAMVPLAAHPKPPRRGRRASEAAEMAGQQIDKIGDPSATDEERRQRKRRLIKGPREFREMRGDQPKKT